MPAASEDRNKATLQQDSGGTFAPVTGKSFARIDVLLQPEMKERHVCR
jgi:hypothetical protein